MCGAVDVVLAYFITTRLWFMQNCIIHNHGFHQRSQSNYLARLVFQYCGSGMEKIGSGIWDKYPGSATLLVFQYF
jgi:hypothetical protein